MTPQKEKIKEYLKLLCGFLLVLAVYIPFGCPIRFFTGISCAGCGMSRAYLQLLHLNFREAFYYHPLFVCPIIFVIVFILSELGFPKKYAKAIYSVIVILFIAVYVYRMISPDDNIVVFEPQNGFIFRSVKYLISIIS